MGHILRQGYVAEKSIMDRSESSQLFRIENHHQFPNLQSGFAKSKWVRTPLSTRNISRPFSSLRDVPEFNNFIQVLPVWMSIQERPKGAIKK